MGSPLELVAKASRSRRPAGELRVSHATATQLRDHEIDEVVAFYREVNNVRVVAQRFHLNRNTIAKHLASRGIVTSKSMRPDEIALATEFYAEGQSSIAIGKRLGFDNHTIISALRAHGVVIRAALGR